MPLAKEKAMTPMNMMMVAAIISTNVEADQSPYPTVVMVVMVK